MIGAERLKWSSEVVAQIDAAIAEEVAATRLSTRLFATVGPFIGRPIPAGRTTTANYGGVNVRVLSDAPMPCPEFWVEPFGLTTEQAQSPEAWLPEIVAQFRGDANVLCRAEDWMVFNGCRAFEPPPPPAGAPDPRPQGLRNVTYRSIGWPNGLIAAAAAPAPGGGARPVNAVGAGPWPAYRRALFDRALVARAELQGNGFLGPFALVVAPQVMSAYLRHEQGSSTAARLEPLLTAGVHASDALGQNAAGDFVGLLLSVESRVLDIAYASALTGAYESQDALGLSRCRVFDRLVLRVKDRMGIALLTFAPPP